MADTSFTPPHPNWRFRHEDLLAIEGLDSHDLTPILDIAQYYADLPKNCSDTSTLLKGFEVVNLFFENSTRTRTSFETAAIRLGANVINIVAQASSIKKGESLIDTAVTLNAMSPDLLVVRHQEAGAVTLLAQKISAAVINAGDGAHEHPTQALLDALTIRQHCGKLHGLRVAICGDIAHSRVCRSNLHLLSAMGAEVRLIAPPTLMPPAISDLGANCFTDMKKGLEGCDIVMMLRLQQERMQGSYVPSIREYFEFYGLDHDKLQVAKPNALIMHPGPMNRGIEIDTDLADHSERSLINQQVKMGVAVRMALLDILTRPQRMQAA